MKKRSTLLMHKTYHCEISRYKVNENILNPVRGGGKLETPDHIRKDWKLKWYQIS